MSRLAELTACRNLIAGQLANDQELRKALFYTDSDFLAQPDVAPEQIMYSHLYPYAYSPTAEESPQLKKSYIAVSLKDYAKAGGGAFMAGNLFIHAITHRDLFRTDYDCIRPDYFVSKIYDLLAELRGIGVGSLEFAGMTELVVNEYFMGNVLQYRPLQFR
ncbi:hypothetical protein [Paenibacillus sp. GCM10027626]|uniref:hypothetical protein n=1 Tax=Paenibacillus sp. GCM10027626 TaxID=3273411 RepID=UPI00363185A2